MDAQNYKKIRIDKKKHEKHNKQKYKENKENN